MNPIIRRRVKMYDHKTRDCSLSHYTLTLKIIHLFYRFTLDNITLKANLRERKKRIFRVTYFLIRAHLFARIIKRARENNHRYFA